VYLVEAERPQVSGDELRGAKFPVRQFRVLVDVMAPGYELVVDAPDLVLDARISLGGLAAKGCQKACEEKNAGIPLVHGSRAPGGVV
jgi:hypothetical protein